MVNYEKVSEIIESLKDKLKKEVQEKEEFVISTKESLRKEFERRTREAGIEGDVLVGGSIEKGTWLPEKLEFDIFIRIRSAEGFKRFYTICPEGERMLGSRDYFRIEEKEYGVEIIPIKYIERPEEAEDITDLSPFHVEYVNSRTNEDMKYDIRLLKRFMMKKGVYGAETHVGGFSGYLAELLIINYGSLLSLFKAVESEWKSKIYLDPEGYYRNYFDAKFHLGEDKTYGPMIFVDPTFRYRNAAAALSLEAYSKFIFYVRMFLRNPSEEYFLFEEKITDEVLKRRAEERGTLVLIYKIKKSGKEDFFLGKLKRVSRRIGERLREKGIPLYDCGFFYNKEGYYLFFELESTQFSKKERRIGPPVWVSAKYFDAFCNKHGEVYVYKNNLVADVPRQDLQLLLKQMIEEYQLEILEWKSYL